MQAVIAAVFSWNSQLASGSASLHISMAFLKAVWQSKRVSYPETYQYIPDKNSKKK